MINQFLARTREITLRDLAAGHNRDYLIRSTTSELGEYCEAVTVTEGQKRKEITETPRQEAVDLVICALALFYAEGGTDEELAQYGMQKLDKWENAVKEG